MAYKNIERNVAVANACLDLYVVEKLQPFVDFDDEEQYFENLERPMHLAIDLLNSPVLRRSDRADILRYARENAPTIYPVVQDVFRKYAPLH